MVYKEGYVKKRKITLIPIGGLANRISAMTSAINYCLDFDWQLKIIWFKDYGLNCLYTDIFSLEGLSNNKIEIRDATWTDYLLKDRPRRKNLFFPELFQYFFYDRRYYESELYARKSFDYYLDGIDRYNQVYMVECAAFYNNRNCGHYFRPIEIVETAIQRNLALLNSRMIGIHIRRTDSVDSIKYSPIDFFIKKMKEEIQRDEDVIFYVASDSMEDKKILKSIFGNKVYWGVEQVSRNSVQGIRDAVVDLFTLSHGVKIIGSYSSSFSQIASELSCIPLERIDGRVIL